MSKINYLAVAIAAIAAFMASAVWYIVFSHQYFELRGINPNDTAATAMPAWQALTVLVRHLVVAFALAYLVARLGIVGWKSALQLGLPLWIGFPAVLLAGSVIHDNVPDNVPWMLAAIHAGDWLVKILLMTVILGVSRWTLTCQ
jgi:Protein of unknown function (DUF1761)